MKKILVPCDFSDHSQQAYKFATDFASINGGEVAVLYVIDLPYFYETTFGVQPYWNSSNVFNDLAEEVKKRYGKMKDMFAEVTAHVSLLIERGPVTPAILRSIEETGADLVVMGTQGASGLREYFVGSNTEKIVRYSPVPVFAIRKAPVISAVKNIVFPCSLQLNQMELVKQVKELQALFDAKLYVLYVNTPPRFLRDREARLALEEFAEHYDLKNYTLNIRSDPFESEGIISFAKEIHADIIAMGTTARRGITHLLFGSITEDVVNHVDCPIWTYPVRKKEKGKNTKLDEAVLSEV